MVGAVTVDASGGEYKSGVFGRIALCAGVDGILFGARRWTLLDNTALWNFSDAAVLYPDRTVTPITDRHIRRIHSNPIAYSKSACVV